MYYATKFEAITGHVTDVTDDGTLLVPSPTNIAPSSLICVRGFWAFNISAQCEVNAWICAPATERDLASFSAVKKVSVWLCAFATDRVSGFISQAANLNM